MSDIQMPFTLRPQEHPPGIDFFPLSVIAVAIGMQTPALTGPGGELLDKLALYEF